MDIIITSCVRCAGKFFEVSNSSYYIGHFKSVSVSDAFNVHAIVLHNLSIN